MNKFIPGQKVKLATDLLKDWGWYKGDIVIVKSYSSHFFLGVIIRKDNSDSHFQAYVEEKDLEYIVTHDVSAIVSEGETK